MTKNRTPDQSLPEKIANEKQFIFKPHIKEISPKVIYHNFWNITTEAYAQFAFCIKESTNLRLQKERILTNKSDLQEHNSLALSIASVYIFSKLLLSITLGLEGWF